ncbi:MAG: glycosyltransferase, partial [Ilumatobacteraceae bacterium]
MTGSMNARCVGFVEIGPKWHGVTRFGRLLERAARSTTCTTVVRRLGSGALEPVVAPSPRPAVWYSQFTDHLLGRTPEQSVLAMAQLRGQLAPSRLVVTMHDLPGAASTPARRSAYRRVATAASAVVVCSEHERTLLRSCGFDGPVVVIPHFVEARPATAIEPGPSSRVATVAVLGFLYPGKGHMAVLEACARAAADVHVLALGAPSPGHADLAEQLLAAGRRLDVGCTVTGWLSEHALDGRLATADVPVTAHEALSASSSVATWIAAG